MKLKLLWKKKHCFYNRKWWRHINTIFWLFKKWNPRVKL